MGWLTDYLEKLSLIDYAAKKMDPLQAPSSAMRFCAWRCFLDFVTVLSQTEGNSLRPIASIYTSEQYARMWLGEQWRWKL